MNVIMVCAWMVWSSDAVKHECYYGLGTDALVIRCSCNLALCWFGHGCSGHRRQWSITLWVSFSGTHEMLLRYAACDDHNMTTTVTAIAMSGVGGRGRCPGSVSGGRWPLSGDRCPVAAGVWWPVAGWKAAEKVCRGPSQGSYGVRKCSSTFLSGGK